MTQFGGLGGVRDGRPFQPEDLFEAAVARALGDQIKVDDEVCREMWAALANTDWRHTNGDGASYSFRGAEDLVAAVRGRGDYMDWYCSMVYPLVTERIREALAREGWEPEVP